MTLIKICEFSDKEASKFIEANVALGWEIISRNKTYYTYFHTSNVYRAPDAVFTTGHDGTYEFVKE